MKLNTKIFADGADLNSIKELNNNPIVKGFTTNPSLMKKAGVENYETFAKQVLEIIDNKPISFEVFSDDIDEMYDQALKIASWGKNIYVKIPITNTKNVSVFEITEKLSKENVKLNITALMTNDQVKHIFPALSESSGAYVSVFAGRIADTGIDPLPVMKNVLKLISSNKNIELIWASPREVFNVIQASDILCQIITVTPNIIEKLSIIEKDLDEYSLETVKAFYKDALSAGYKI